MGSRSLQTPREVLKLLKCIAQPAEGAAPGREGTTVFYSTVAPPQPARYSSQSTSWGCCAGRCAPVGGWGYNQADSSRAHVLSGRPGGKAERKEQKKKNGKR